MLLDFSRQEKIFRDYSLKRPKTVLAKTFSEAKKAADKIKKPLVLKIYSQKHLHRTDVGGVVTGVESVQELKESYNRLMKIPAVQGVLIQEQIKGYEFVMGVKEDEVFGKFIMLGTGGVMVELFNDVSFKLLPFSKKDADEMLKEIKGSVLLKGFRGGEVIDEKILTDTLLNVGKMAVQEDIKDADFNPVIVNSRGAFFCDAKISV